MQIPDWVQDATFYQIFPDRFANGNPGNDPVNVQAWGASPTRWHYQGGDLTGITKHLDYLVDLGINAIYLNPIFHSSANHRYHIIDYFKVDPFLGDLEDFHELIREANRKGIRIILDGVLNHCGRGFFAFNNVLENKKNSPYKDWFHIRRFPLDAYSRGNAINFKAWWDIKELPKFNTDNPAVRDYLFGMTRYWLEVGIDGWRLDVPNEIDDDEFWAEYRNVVKSVNPDAYLVGEIWETDTHWVNDDHFDGLMNYPLRDAILDPLSHKAGFDLLAHVQDELLSVYTPAQWSAMYNPLGSHDTKRVMTKLRGSLARAKLAYSALFAHPGAPAIYYGDEIGLRGGLDPASRAAFPWDESQWNMELHDWIKRLTSIRKASAPLRRGAFKRLHLDIENKTMLFERSHNDKKVWVALNYSPSNQRFRVSLADMSLDAQTDFSDLLSGDTLFTENGFTEIRLAPFGARWLAIK
ncbi:MAG: alpha-amylase [Chloroflexi bacterium]|nr:glycoside hydrolase family 13 protein [Chloroflexota bacterium]MQC26977.1 alpha-amylase [Chloroflexota bacterium]